MESNRYKPRLIPLIIVVVLFSGCLRNQTGFPVSITQEQVSIGETSIYQGKRPYWPTDTWLSAEPQEQGMDPILLEDMVNSIQDNKIKLHSVLIIRKGYIVEERYYSPYEQDDLHQQWSVTKSIISTLVGIAIQDGFLPGVNTPLSEFFPEIIMESGDSRKADLTLEHLLSMSAGLKWSDDANIAGMFASASWPEYVLKQPLMANPGDMFNYNSGNTHILSSILQSTTGMSTLEYAQKRLFNPLGIKRVKWDQDRDGIYIGGWGLSLKPRDMAKIGFLYLNGGRWNGKQIVPQEWVRRSVQRYYQLEDPLEPWELWYSYGWWIHEFGSYAAHGRGGQFIFVAPQYDLVVVFTSDLTGSDFIQPALLMRDFIIPAVRVDQIQ